MAIRKITKDGVVTTIISGEKCDDILTLAYHNDSDSIFYSRRTAICRILNNGTGFELWVGSLNQPGNLDGYGLNARFQGVFGISIEQSTGEIYLADTNSNSIRKVGNDRKVTTLVKGLNTPMGIQVLNNNTAVFSELYGHRIQKYDFETGSSKTIAGIGVAGTFDGF